MMVLLKIAGWVISLLLIALGLFSSYTIFSTHSGITAVKLLGPLLVYGGLATIFVAAATVNPLVNQRLRPLMSGVQAFVAGSALTVVLTIASFSAYGAWAAGADSLDKHQPDDAIGFLSYAANYGPEEAKFELARAYWTAKPSPENKRQAFVWMKRAAEANVTLRAKTYLGVMYDKGIGTPVDRKAAASWYQQAAEEGDAAAASALGDLIVDQDPSAAARWYTQAVEGGYTDAGYALGLQYSKGNGVAKDYVQAARYYRIAADAGNLSAALNYGSMLFNGDLGQRDRDGAISNFEKAAKSEDPDIRRLAEENLAIARR